MEIFGIIIDKRFIKCSGSYDFGALLYKLNRKYNQELIWALHDLAYRSTEQEAVRCLIIDNPQCDGPIIGRISEGEFQTHYDYQQFPLEVIE